MKAVAERDRADVPEAFEAGWLRALSARYRVYAIEARVGGAAEAAAAFDRLVQELEAEVAALGVVPAETRLPETDPDLLPHRMQEHDVWRLAVADREHLFEALSTRAGEIADPARMEAMEARARAQVDAIARWRLERRRAARRRPAATAPTIRSPEDLEAFHAAALRQIEQAREDVGRQDETPLLALVEDLFEALLDIAESTSDPVVQTRAQELAEALLTDLRRIRASRGSAGGQAAPP